MTITSSSTANEVRIPAKPQVQPLTFPALPFAKLAPSAFLSAHLSRSSGSIRPSGRSPKEIRTPSIHTGSLTHAHGSAVVRHGDTAVVCGVRGEILRVEDIPDWDPERDGIDQHSSSENNQEQVHGHSTASAQSQKPTRRVDRTMERSTLAKLNLLVPNIELATGCSPGNLPGGPPTAQAQTVTQRILTLLHRSDLVPLSDLQIWSSPLPGGTAVSSSRPSSSSSSEDGQKGGVPITLASDTATSDPRLLKAFWTLYIDIIFLSLSGPPFDTAWLAVIAALKNTRLPEVWWDSDRDLIVCENAFPRSIVPSTAGKGKENTIDTKPPEVGRKLNLREVPVALSFGLFWEDGSGTGNATTGGSGSKPERRKWMLLDLDGFEEAVCAETGTVVVGEDGRLVRVEKDGGGVVGFQEIRDIVDIAGTWRKKCLSLIEGG